MNLKNGVAQWNPKEKYTCPAPEDITSGSQMAITLNPDFDPCDNYLQVSTTNHVKLLHLLKYCHINVVPEVSSGGRIHYHGTIEVHQIIPFFLEDMRQLRRYGTYCIKIIKDEDWEVYCAKQKDLMKPYCKLNRQPYLINKDIVAADKMLLKRRDAKAPIDEIKKDIPNQLDA